MSGGNLGIAVQMLKIMNQQGGSQSWEDYWKSQTEVLFFGLYSEISGGQMPNKKTGSSDYLTVAGSAGSETYQCPNTAPYIAADTDYIWFKTDESQRTVTTAELIGYDLQRTPVKYQDASPNEIVAIIILNAAVTGTKRDNLFKDMWLPILWDNDLNGYGHIKSNRIGYYPYVPIKYLDLPNGNAYAYIADNGALDINDDPFILCGWVKAYDKLAIYNFFGKGVAGSKNGRYAIYSSSASGCISCNGQAGTTSRTVNSDIDATDGWHFVMLEIYPVAANTGIRMYIDNQFFAGDVYQYSWGTLDNQFEFYIGAGNNGTGSDVAAIAKASIRDVRIYRIALTDEQKTQLYNGVNITGYIARWKCDAYPLVDETGNYDLTGVNLSTANIKEI